MSPRCFEKNKIIIYGSLLWYYMIPEEFVVTLPYKQVCSVSEESFPLNA